MILRHLAAGTLLLCLATSSLAQDAPRPLKWYVGVDAGESKLIHESGFTRIDDTSSSWSLRAGYQFSRFFALEAGYIDLGDFSSEAGTSPVVHQTGSLTGLALNSRFMWPIARHFQLNATLGMLYHESDTTYDTSSGYSSADSYSNLGFAFGVGMAVPVNDNLEVGVGYTDYIELSVPFNFTGNPSLTTEFDTYVIALSARFRF